MYVRTESSDTIVALRGNSSMHLGHLYLLFSSSADNFLSKEKHPGQNCAITHLSTQSLPWGRSVVARPFHHMMEPAQLAKGLNMEKTDIVRFCVGYISNF